MLECSPDHQEALAARPNIGEKVTEALAACETASVLTTLVRNATARISPVVFERLAEKSRHIECLQEPLTQRKDMPPEVAIRMCAFVSETLKTFIARNFTIEPERLQAALVEAEASVQRPLEPAAGGDNANKLIDKLFSAGQLKAGFLIRVLQQGNIDLFELGFARLLDMTLAETRQALYEHGPKSVAMACRATGIDRCVFPTVYNLSRKARAMRPALTANDIMEVDAIFGKFTKTAALSQIQGG